jgi:hypothetical protein
MTARTRWAHVFVGIVAATALSVGVAACASGSSSRFGQGQGQGEGDSGADSTTGLGDSGPGFSGDTGPGFGGGDTGTAGSCAGTLMVTPASAIVTVTITSAGVQTMPATFTAQCDGANIPVVWSLDRGDLGAIGLSTGVFTASGQGAGVGTVTASAGSSVGTATVTVQILTIENGAPASEPDAGAGGYGGVGGVPLGGSVPAAVQTKLQGAETPDAGLSAGTLKWLYPYDQTVWPQGVLPPLLQWSNPPTAATAVYIHLKQANYEFQGFYSGTDLVNQPIDATAWTTATNGNGGDPLHVEVTVTDGTHVYGPIAENWIIAPGQLKGIVYYSSYNTTFATPVIGAQPANVAAAILSIRSGSTSPTLAIPAAQGKCMVCHEVSADGATLVTSNGQGYPNYDDTYVFSLQTGMQTQMYTANAPDGTTNDRKFLWSGLWRDGSFALQSTGLTTESYGDWNAQTNPDSDGGPVDTDSRIFRRTDGDAVPAPGFDGQVKDAVTPAFSPDGTMVAFNYLFAQPGATGLAPGNGHTLDLMDFACGMPLNAGDPPSPTAGPACGSLQFSGLRRLFTSPTQAAPGVGPGFAAWPAWLPDSSSVVFQNTVYGPPGTSAIATWNGVQAQLWIVGASASTTPQAVALNALNGIGPTGTSYLPTNATHPNDTVLNYQPTVSPIASGGYFWVVFTSRRMYGNVAPGLSGDGFCWPADTDAGACPQGSNCCGPWDIGDGKYPVNKKLWVAAIDLNPTQGKDPSHPAFYLPAQELNAPNMRGYWVPAPCEANGMSCTTGDECCGGFCEQVAGGALECTSTKPTCAAEYDKCTQTSDCCGKAAGYTCINSVCSRPAVE